MLDVKGKSGSQPLFDQTLSLAAARLGHWEVAKAAAAQALAADPGLTDAKRVYAAATQKLTQQAAPPQ